MCILFRKSLFVINMGTPYVFNIYVIKCGWLVTDIKARVPGIWAKGCMLDNCACDGHDPLSLIVGDGHGMLLLCSKYMYL